MITGLDIRDLNKLLPEEKKDLRQLYNKWELARNNKSWAEADSLRHKLMLWGSNIVNDKIWHPQFEHNLNRQRRAFLRMAKYGVPIYPWELRDAVLNEDDRGITT